MADTKNLDKKLTSRLQETPIAIIGMASLFPESRDLHEFWENIMGKVDCVIGYEIGPRGGVRPAFIYDAADATRLTLNEACVHNLVTYLHDKKKPPRRGEEPPRVAVVAKPCDSRAVNVLLAEGQVERERIFVIGVVCEGLEDEEGAALPRCLRCADRVPVVYDVLLGEAPEVSPVEDGFSDLASVEEMDA